MPVKLQMTPLQSVLEEQGDRPSEDVCLTWAHGAMLSTGGMRAGCPLRANF